MRSPETAEGWALLQCDSTVTARIALRSTAEHGCLARTTVAIAAAASWQARANIGAGGHREADSGCGGTR